MPFFIILLGFLGLFPIQANAEPLFYHLSDSHNYRLENIYYVENVGTHTATDITVEVQYTNPYLTKIMPYSTNLHTFFEPQPIQIDTDVKGNQTGRYEISRLKPGEKKIMRVLHDYRASLIDYFIEPEKIKTYGQFQSETLQPYLSPSMCIESEHPLIRAKAGEIVGTETNPYEKAKRIFTFVNEYMTYSIPEQGREAVNKGALCALQTGKGVCEDYADLMVALLRATGVPARTVSGWAGEVGGEGVKIIADSSSINAGHMWLEYYLPGYGWIPADPTFSYTVNDERRVDYDRLTGIKQPSFAESCEMEGHAISYSFRGDVRVSCDTNLYRLDNSGMLPLPADNTTAPLLYLEDIPLLFDVNPMIENSRTLVPMRGIFEALGAVVDWDGATQRITAAANGRQVEMQIGYSRAWVNREARFLDVPPEIKENRTMIPLRFVGEALGCRVDWDGNMRTINLHFN